MAKIFNAMEDKSPRADIEWDSMLSSLCQISHVHRQVAAVADADEAWRDWVDRREVEQDRWLSRMGCMPRSSKA